MILAVHQPHYLPWLGYFDKIKKSDCFVFLDDVRYKRREFQNRNKIRTKNGWMWLTVPVLSKGLKKQLIRDVRINNTADWQKEHWKSLRAWYGKAKFFDNYAPFFEDLYTGKKWDRLVDLNVFIIKLLLKELEIKTPLYFESELGITGAGTERIIEICKKFKADIYFSGIGSKEYLEEEKFAQEGIMLKYQNFNHPVYSQLFVRDAVDFVYNMAAIDLLFNEGEMNRKILWKKEDTL